MAQDRFVRWKKDGPRPSREQVKLVCEDYFRGIGTVEWDETGGRFMIEIIGRISHPMNRISVIYKRPEPEPGFEGRWMEVCLSKTSLDVITREQDAITSAIAMGLAKVFVDFWKGELEAT